MDGFLDEGKGYVPDDRSAVVGRSVAELYPALRETIHSFGHEPRGNVVATTVCKPDIKTRGHLLRHHVQILSEHSSHVARVMKTPHKGVIIHFAVVHMHANARTAHFFDVVEVAATQQS